MKRSLAVSAHDGEVRWREGGEEQSPCGDQQLYPEEEERGEGEADSSRTSGGGGSLEEVEEELCAAAVPTVAFWAPNGLRSEISKADMPPGS
mmetsp:Transcript_31110/g.72717  ORF Transcript_31110/g.72717 Transcript_31110/m.72717 type:complete len:92 (-) Transcript_31110:574-849(-)